MEGTKTTMYLSTQLRGRLKALAAQRGTTMTALLVEGAEMLLAQDEARADQAELARRAAEARRQLRAGLYEGPAIADRADELAYDVEPST